MTFKQLKWLYFLLIPGLFFSCGDEQRESSIETPEITFEREGEMELLKEDEVIKILEIEIADSLMNGKPVLCTGNPWAKIRECYLSTPRRANAAFI
jgi:hypothetical protein